MKRLIEILAPTDPPFVPMAFTRMPIVHRFWYGGLLAGLAGFVLGFGLWMWQHGYMIVEGHYFLFKSMHAHIQIEGFVGSFLLGFGLQSGPHVAGGKPPASDALMKLLYLLWGGLLCSFLIEVVGNVLVSGAYLGAGYFLLQVTLGGNPLLRAPRGVPLAGGMAMMASAPWLELDDPAVALFVLWCGPVTVALVAAQQLINNVLRGRMLQGGMGWLFAACLVLTWLATGVKVFAEWGAWWMVGTGWLATLGVLVVGTDLPRAMWRFGWKSINVTLGVGFAFAFAGGAVLLDKEVVLDVVVHLLAAGMLTTLIIGVTARVAGFFSAGAVLPDRVVSCVVALWGGVALMRSVSPVLPMEEIWTVWLSLLGGLLLIVWGVRTWYRLTQIEKLLPDSIK